MKNLKLRAARLSIATATGLALLKFFTGILTGSLAILASAIDSLLDILMSGVNYLAIRQAEQPADKNHPFGHGKYETLAALFQAFIIAASGAWIIFESVQRLRFGTEISQIGGGILVLLFSTLVSWAISNYLRSTARKTDSAALEADALHFSMDVYTNLALAAGLVVVHLTQAPRLDALLSLGVAIYIIMEAVKLVRRGLRDVLDEELPDSVRQQITRLIEENKCELSGFHNLRTRRAGSQKIMDFHLTVCKHLSVQEAHDIADHLEKKIENEIRGADVTIHIEPCVEEKCPGLEQCTNNNSKLAHPTHK
jgi:ferrous-iron efflux pump FieF